jgi:hypothetical protein
LTKGNGKRRFELWAEAGECFFFQTVRGSLAEVLADRDMASLGDAYVNFVYSLALSNRIGKAFGREGYGSVLA